MHKPVLLKESLEFLDIKPGLTYVDCTLGLGGHSLEILKKLNGTGKLICLEHDEEIFKVSKDKLQQFNNCHLYNVSFIELPSILKELQINKIDGGILLDLGINSIHLDNAERGFSFRQDGPLDMRMDKRQPLSAYEVVNDYKEFELADIIYQFGEDRLSRKIAKAISYHKDNHGAIKTTSELANIILKCYHNLTNKKYFKIHPATRTFQAIRIEVNKELGNLKQIVCIIPELLLPGCRLSVISFHSLEDRITKNFLKDRSNFKTLTKKPITPSSGELKDNQRSRSAKLRAAEKLQNEIILKNNE